MGRWLLPVFGALVLGFLVFPVVVVLPVSLSSAKYLQFPPPGFSLQWYANFFGRADWVGAALLSFQIGLAVMAVSTVLGTAAAFGLVRGRFPGRDLANAFIVSPLIIPAIIVAIGVYFFYARLKLIGSPLSLIAAHTALAVPFVVVNVSATLYGFDRRLEHAAMNLGADSWQTFRHVTLPIIRPGVIAGALLAFITSFDELIVALFIAGTGLTTLPRKMWASIQFEIDPTIAAVSTCLVVLSVALLGSAELLRRRSVRLRTAVLPEPE